MKHFFFPVIFSCLLSSLSAQEQVREFKMPHGDTTYHMKKYFLCIYLSGPNQNQDSLSLVKLQEEHLNHIFTLSKKGITCLSGPFGDDTNKRGILLFDVATMEEAEAWVKKDPMVMAGKLSYEIHPWWGAKGSFLK